MRGYILKKMSFQQWTADDKFPPNPQYDTEEEWENSFLNSNYHLINITSSELNGKDYDFILVAFDDEDGNINSEYIKDNRLTNFINDGTTIHYEKIIFIR